jgi:hypothetical protein
MFPHERSLVERLKNAPFALVGVNSDANADELRKTKFVEEKITWRSFADETTGGPIAKDWKVQGWPTLYLIDAAGNVRHCWIGPPEREEHLDGAIDRLLEEAKQAAAPPKSGH